MPADWAERYGFRDLAAVARIDSVRRVGDRPAQRLTRYVVLPCLLPADKALRVVRAHWTIENRLHWLLDVVFNEDQARSRKDYAGENLPAPPTGAEYSATRPERSALGGKMKRAGWNDTYLNDLFGQMG